MVGRVKVTIEDNWDGVIGAVRETTNLVVTKSAFDVNGAAQEAAPVDTGAYKASHYVKTQDHSDYGAAANEAQSAQPGVELFPDDAPVKYMQALILVGVAYGFWVHNGTEKRVGTPNIERAMNEYTNTFFTAMAAALNNISGVSARWRTKTS